MEIKSAFFEFQKMFAFLQMGVGVHLGHFRFAPIEVSQRYIYSLLIIDLFSIVDRAVEQVLLANGIETKNNTKARMKALEGEGLILNAPYLKWYKEWRNEVAHNQKKLEFSELRQASEDVQKQLVDWKLAMDFDVRPHYLNPSEDTYYVGSRIDAQPILEYQLVYSEQPGGKSASTKETINLSLVNYLNLPEM